MNIEQLKTDYPEVYQAGIEAERERVQAWMKYLDADRPKVIAGIKNGTALTARPIAELTRAMIAKHGPIKTDREKALEAFEAEVDRLRKR